MKVLGILQARFSSARLPGKVLKPILGRPMLALQLERLKRARRLDGLIVATSGEASDDPIVRLCGLENVEVSRGSLDDVLDRFYRAAEPRSPTVVVRLTGDCPLADPALIDRCVDELLAGGADYAANSLEPTYPDGLDVEAFRFEALARAWREAKLPSEREHVTPFIHTQRDAFRVIHIKGEPDLSTLRWTVDEPVDFELMTRIYEALYPSKPAFTTADILALLDEHPDWKTYNTRHARNEGFAKSLRKDEEWKTDDPPLSEVRGPS